MSAPKRVNVMRVITYDLEELRKDMGVELETADEIIEFLEDWVTEDFGNIPASRLIYQDENGEELA